jgi:RNA polymerase sigma-70 factor (ECF subfamily)
MESADDTPLAEAQLVQRCLAGDTGAFQALAERYYRPVSAFLYRRVQRFDIVEDLAQETFLEAFRSLRAGQLPRHFSSWLFGIAHNIAGKWLRRKRPVLFDPADPPATPVITPEIVSREEQEEHQKRMAELAAAVENLPDDIRELLGMKHKLGRTCEQIAAEQGRPVGTIKSLLSRAYKTLRERLRPAGEDVP